jgi:hypothetical protein
MIINGEFHPGSVFVMIKINIYPKDNQQFKRYKQMKTIEFKTTIKNNIIRIPRGTESIENKSVTIHIVESKSNKNSDTSKQALLDLFGLMKKEPMFNDIADPVLWQKGQRDDW